MFDYFIKTKRPVWNIDDAFKSFIAENPDLTVEQQLTKFYDLLKKHDDSLVQSWLLKWKSFCKKPENPTNTPPTKIKFDMRKSQNPNVTIGNITNYNNKRMDEDKDKARITKRKIDQLFEEAEESDTQEPELVHHEDENERIGHQQKQQHSDEIHAFFNNSSRTEEIITLANPPTPFELDFSEKLYKTIKEESYFYFQEKKVDFTDYKLQCLRHLVNQKKNYLEAHFAEIIALSHSMLLKFGSYSRIMVDTFSLNFLEAYHQHLLTDVYDLNTDSILSRTFINQLTQELSLLNLTNQSEIYEKIELLKIAEKGLKCFDKQSLKMVLELLEFLPKYHIDKLKTNEENLKVKFFEPFFKYFFNNKETGLYMDYPETSPKERKIRTVSAKRPDMFISFYSQSKKLHNVSFCEIKPESCKSSKSKLVKDLYKLIHFGKDAVDSCVPSPMLIQVVGPKVTFYLQNLVSKGCYITFEVFSMTLPTCVDEIASILQCIDKIAKLYLVLLQNKDKLSKVIVDEMKSDSLATPEVERIVEKIAFKNDIDFLF